MKKTPLIVSGHAFVGEDLALLPADIIIEDGIVTAVEEIRQGTARLDLSCIF